MSATHKGTLAILTGGGDVPGLNPAIRAITIRALREGYRVLGIRHGWAGLVDLVPDPGADITSPVRTQSGGRRPHVRDDQGRHRHSHRRR